MPEGSGMIDQGNPHGSPSQAPLPSTLGNGRIESNLTTERSLMIDNHGAACNRDALLENFAAELTSAAYAVALRHGVEGKWLDLELELWEALKEAVKKWEQGSPRFSAVP